MKMKWYKTWDYKTRRNYWWTQRYTDKGICFEIRVNEFNSDVLNLYMCDKLISKHTDLIDAKKAAEKALSEI